MEGQGEEKRGMNSRLEQLAEGTPSSVLANPLRAG
jgi:hypothetical protein